MKKRKFIIIGFLLGIIAGTGCGQGDQSDAKIELIRGNIRMTLKKLKGLGIDYTQLEDVLVSDMLGYPEDMLADIIREPFAEMTICDLGCKEYLVSKGVESDQLDKLYSFDMEVMYIEGMYINFLNNVMTISQGELVFSDISEDLSAVDFDSGTGTMVVRFVYNGKSYEYPAGYYHDWFDFEIVPFVNQVLEEHGNDKQLYGMSDGSQSLILFYATEEWAAAFNQAFKPDFKLTKEMAI